MYWNLFKKECIVEEALDKVFEGFSILITKGVNDSLMNEMTQRDLGVTVMAIAKGKAPEHDGLPIDFFQTNWPTHGPTPEFHEKH